MKTELSAKACGTIALDHILGSAVVLNWDAVACQSRPAKIRIEYHIGMDGAVDYLKLWACGREYWTLICDYSPHVGWSDGPRFSNGFHSRTLGRLLQSIMLNQNLFRNECSPNSNVTLEVGTPTMEDTSHATERVNEAFQRAS